MSAARESFYTTIAMMQDLTTDPLLTETLPINSERNQKARILRNGVAVSAFSTLETYLEDSLEERISELSKSKIPYSNFEDGLKRFLTIEAVAGLATRVGFTPDADRQAFTELQLPKLSKFGLGRPSYSAMGFSPRGSNVGEKDITAALKSFGIGGGWQTLSNILSMIGAGIVSLEANFRNFSSDRNKAAHTITHNIPTATLVTHLETAIRIGISFDIATTFCIRTLSAATNIPNFRSALTLANLTLRFVDQKPNGWEESFNSVVVKLHPDLQTASDVVKRRRGRQMTVVRDQQGFPIGLL